MKLQDPNAASWRQLIPFCVLQLVIIASGVSLYAHRFRTTQEESRLPELRRQPLIVGPLYDYPDVVSDEQLVRVLEKLKPRFRGAHPKINYVDHALRFWGIDAVFDDPDCLSGVEMRELLLDHRRFAQAWGTDAQPFLIDANSGIRLRTQQGRATASHVDHTLASLVEVGTPADYPVITPQGETEFREILEQTLLDFSLNQAEYEWSALVFALYVPQKRWISAEGQEITFDRLADRIMRQRLSQGVCQGNHRLHALVMLLRVDEQFDILTVAGRRRVVAYLQDVSLRMISNQHEEGYMSSGWPGLEREGDSPANSSLSTLTTRILVTGHVMEWWSLAPREIQPPRDVLVKAGQWLCKTIDGLSPRQVEANYTFLSHAGRALALWRGRFPAEVDLDSTSTD